ncbi:hypothetical protein NRE15_05965 [Fundicoccus culcitae]|uniref:NERD domain-containing protein n=1 Tax=Fundicoccus culcitae TaxID=2969821 RepID=A0ABY5P8U5_9LACT|nr:hypothetical protein [Fundicoccus culcitae]UUX35186.1 hypothetical protein NRE15_05965 [Fundicoccus culcitae]
MNAEFILISADHWIVIAIKNYPGHYEHDQGITSKLDGKEFFDSSFYYMYNRTYKIDYITHLINPDIKVTSLMIFINEHSFTDINTSYDIEIIQRNGVKHFIENLAPVTPLSEDLLAIFTDKLNKYHVENPEKFESLQPSDFDSLQKGIYCPHCLSFNTEVRRSYIQCKDCEATETKAATVLRHVNELKVLFHQHPKMLKTKNLYDLMNHQIPPRTIRKYIKQNQ